VSVRIYSGKEAVVLENPGKRSAQLLCGGNAPDAPFTVTRVDMDPGAVSPRHSHPNADQVWIVERGTATMLLDAGGSRGIAAGDVVQTPKGHVHGVENTGAEPFVYLTVTCPPEDMTVFYESRRDATPDEGA
jgi:quercetin dioxygenase-like cupin family protein